MWNYKDALPYCDVCSDWEYDHRLVPDWYVCSTKFRDKDTNLNEYDVCPKCRNTKMGKDIIESDQEYNQP